MASARTLQLPAQRYLMAALAVGVALGVMSVLADGVIRLRALGLVGNIVSPWVLAAFVVGRLAATPRRGALAGMITLVIGVVAYYVLSTIRFLGVTADESVGLVTGYAFASANLVWVLAALVVGPILGMSGAWTARERPPLAAAIAPAVVLLAEAGFLVVNRRVWLWNLAREPHRLNDLAVILGLVVGAIALVSWLTRGTERAGLAYVLTVVGGGVGSLGLVLLYELIVVVA